MIVVLGAGGLLGSTICKLHPKDTIGYTRSELDVTNLQDVRRVLEEDKPDAVINCAGIVPNSPRKEDMPYVNGEFPHILEEMCTKLDIRLVHVSTDCVFDGLSGFDRAMTYNEHSTPNAREEYGWTKAQGEFIRPPHIVIRTSFVGLPDPKGHGLLAWLRRNRGKSVPGWINVLWNGWTVDQIADTLVDLAYRRRIWGLFHLVGEPISKYTLLQVVNQIYGFECSIRREEASVATSRVLSTVYPEIERLYPLQFTKSFKILAQWMKERLGNA